MSRPAGRSRSPPAGGWVPWRADCQETSGFLLGDLRRTMRPRWTVIAQGVIFGLSHYLRGPYSVALTTVTGVLFGLPRLFGVGIVPMILAHSLLNLILSAPFFLCRFPRTGRSPVRRAARSSRR